MRVLSFIAFVAVFLCQGQGSSQSSPAVETMSEVTKQAGQAIDTYERSTAAMETSSGIKLHKDRRLIASTRQLVEQLRQRPDAWRGPASIYLLQNLNEAGRNLSVNSHILLRNAITNAGTGNTGQSNIDMTRAESLQNAGEILFQASSAVGQLVAQQLGLPSAR